MPLSWLLLVRTNLRTPGAGVGTREASLGATQMGSQRRACLVLHVCMFDVYVGKGVTTYRVCRSNATSGTELSVLVTLDCVCSKL